jgi:methylglyoxal synthase
MKMLKSDGNDGRRLTLAVSAHDSKKESLISLMVEHEEKLKNLTLFATNNTGNLIQNHTGLVLNLLNREYLGGDLQIGGFVASGIVNAVIFLQDPLMIQGNEPEITALLRICNLYNVPMATNIASAEATLHFLFEHADILEKHRFETKLANDLLLSLDA